MTDLTGDAVELLQNLIRNECVNDGTVASGQEIRSAELLQGYLEGAGLEVARYESHPGRASLVARIEGSDPDAPTLCLMGHTDVVPVNPDTWDEDPFGGELIDGEIWGRGAIDMLNITATMAAVVRDLARTGYRPRGSLVYFAVADEEAGGHHGAEWMVDRHWDAVACDYLLTEIGGWSRLAPDGTRRIVVMVAEKGIAWRRLKVLGTPGHGSMPYGADNALVTAAEVVRRLAEYRPAPYIDDLWTGQVATMNLTDDLRAALTDPAAIDGALDLLPKRMAASCHAQTHTTFSPNVVHGGTKTNVIPDAVYLDVDIRTVPGTTGAEVDGHLREALGDLAPQRGGREHVQRGVDPVADREPALGGRQRCRAGGLPRRRARARPARRGDGRPVLPPPGHGRARHGALLARGDARHLHRPISREQRAHRRREPRLLDRPVAARRPRAARLTGTCGRRPVPEGDAASRRTPSNLRRTRRRRARSTRPARRS